MGRLLGKRQRDCARAGNSAAKLLRRELAGARAGPSWPGFSRSSCEVCISCACLRAQGKEGLLRWRPGRGGGGVEMLKDVERRRVNTET